MACDWLSIIWACSEQETDTGPGPNSNMNTVPPGIGIPITDIRRSYCRLIFMMGFPIPLSHYTYIHDNVIKWKHFPRYWPFVRGIHRSPVNSPHKGQWRGALMFSLICVWINGWVNNREAGDLRSHCAHYDVIVMLKLPAGSSPTPHSMWFGTF